MLKAATCPISIFDFGNIKSGSGKKPNDRYKRVLCNVIVVRTSNRDLNGIIYECDSYEYNIIDDKIQNDIRRALSVLILSLMVF